MILAISTHSTQSALLDCRQPSFQVQAGTQLHTGKLPFHSAIAPGQSLAKGGQSMQDYMGEMLFLDVGFGTPAQTMHCYVDTLFSITAVFDAASCTDEICKNHKGFNTTASSTFTKTTTPIGDPKENNFYVEDNITLAGIGFKDTFGLLTNMGGGAKQGALLFDGVFTLNRKSFDSKVKTPVVSMLDQLDEKLISIWVQKGQPNGTASITFGAKDATNCQGDWDFVNTTSVDNWVVKASAVKFGDAMKAESDHTVAVSTFTSYLLGPAAEVANITLALGAYSFKVGEMSIPAVNCSQRGSAPTLEFTINGKVYRIPPEHYIVDLPQKASLNGADVCMLSLGPANEVTNPLFNPTGADWSLSLPLLRSYCTAFEYNDQLRVGFATPNSALAYTCLSTIMLLAASVLALVRLH